MKKLLILLALAVLTLFALPMVLANDAGNSTGIDFETIPIVIPVLYPTL